MTGSLADGLRLRAPAVERYRPARARHPDAIGLDGGVQLPAVFVLEDEGFEGVAQVNGRHRHLVYSMPRPQPLDTGSPLARFSMS